MLRAGLGQRGSVSFLRLTARRLSRGHSGSPACGGFAHDGVNVLPTPPLGILEFFKPRRHPLKRPLEQLQSCAIMPANSQMLQAGRTSERGVRGSAAATAGDLLLALLLMAGILIVPARSPAQTTANRRSSVRLARSSPILKLKPEINTGDRFGDGTPDFLRLDDPADRDSFRRWFTLLAEVEAAQPTEKLPAEISDCAGLIRFAYREALRAHDADWMAQQALQSAPAIASVEKYQYPFTPLGAGLWRVRPGSFQAADLSDGTFAQFADAKTLKNLNMHFVSKDLNQARPGDVLFYRQLQQNSPYHSMIFVGRSQLRTDVAGPLVIYHTGSIGREKGEIRVLRVSELMNFPAPRWRPLTGNGNFLGVYRWNILREAN